MKNFVITYDLHHRRDYKRLYQLLLAWKAVKLTESQWLVSLNVGASKALDFVAATLDHDDTVAILELPRGSDWATLRVQPAASNWLSNNVTPRQKAA